MGKNDLRVRLKFERQRFTSDKRRFADLDILSIFMREFSHYDSFFIYNGFSYETRTDLIISKLLDMDKKIYLPRVEGREIVAVPFGEMQKSALGISEPMGLPYKGNIDVTVIPLLAINSRGFRIGYGGGYYDRYLSRVKTLKIGLGYDFQRLEFKEDEFDVPVDKFLCEKGVDDFGK